MDVNVSATDIWRPCPCPGIRHLRLVLDPATHTELVCGGVILGVGDAVDPRRLTAVGAGGSTSDRYQATNADAAASRSSEADRRCCVRGNLVEIDGEMATWRYLP